MTDPSITPGAIQGPDPRRIALPCGGTASRVIELVNDPGGGGHRQLFEVSGKLRVGHTADLANQAEPVYVCGEYGPGTTEIDLRCMTCEAETSIGRFGPDTLVVLTHEAGCAALAALAEVAS